MDSTHEDRTFICVKYFNWMYKMMCDGETKKYYELFRFLHRTKFRYSVAMDENREIDGECLRHRFADECMYSHEKIVESIGNSQCSVLEMLIALSVRCEEQIMFDPELGDHPERWFWKMIENLGLIEMDDRHFDEDYVNDIVQRFLDRRYKSNGDGGLFTVNNCKYDMRKAEIWYQLNWYLSNLI